MCHGQGGLPDRLAAEQFEGGVERNDRQIFYKALGSNEPVEWIAVVCRQACGGERMRNMNWKKAKRLFLTDSLKLLSQILQPGQFSAYCLGRQFVSTGRADKSFAVFNHSFCRT